MSNVKVLGAIELDVGTVSLLHYPKLAERNGQLRIAELPDFSFTLVNADNAKEETLHLRIVNTNSAEDYNREHVAKILGQRFGELLRLENVVKIYGNLLWDASVRPRVEGDQPDYHHYGSSDSVYGPQFHDVHEMTHRLFISPEAREGFGRYHSNNINVSNDGETTINFPLLGGLEAQLKHPYDEGLRPLRHYGHDSSSVIRGSLVGPNGETWSWGVGGNNGHRRASLPLAGQLNVDELKDVIEAAFAKSYPWVPFKIENFVAVIEDNPHSTTKVQLKLVS